MFRFCDIVMKGGITSGVVYPAAVVEISKDFIFKNVGGTSAGAIAAALTAAAERQRSGSGSMAGFERLGRIPAYLADDSHLYKLFTPNSGARSLYRTIVALFGRARFDPALVAKWLALIWAFPISSAIGSAPGIVSLVAVIRTIQETSPFVSVPSLIIAVLTLIGGITVSTAIALVRDVLGVLPKNLCVASENTVSLMR